MKYINAELLPSLFDEEYKGTLKMIEQGETHLDNIAEGFLEAYQVILKVPAADVRENKYGQWTDRLFLKSEILHHARCSSCKKICGVCINGKNIDARFCPNCGAYMQEENDG